MLGPESARPLHQNRGAPPPCLATTWGPLDFLTGHALHVSPAAWPPPWGQASTAAPRRGIPSLARSPGCVRYILTGVRAAQPGRVSHPRPVGATPGGAGRGEQGAPPDSQAEHRGGGQFLCVAYLVPKSGDRKQQLPLSCRALAGEGDTGGEGPSPRGLCGWPLGSEGRGCGEQATSK